MRNKLTIICFSILIKHEATKCKNHDNNNPFILSFVTVIYVSVYNGRLHFTITITNLYNDDKGFQIYISVKCNNNEIIKCMYVSYHYELVFSRTFQGKLV